MTRRASVLELCVAGVGVHKGAFAAAYVAQYAMTAHRLGKFPTAEEYAADWSLKIRVAWQHRERMRDALGEDWREIVMYVAGEISEKMADRDVVRTPVPAALAT